MIRLAQILRWDDVNRVQVEGHSGETYSDVYAWHPAGMVSKPASGRALLMYMDRDSSLPIVLPHSYFANSPENEEGKTKIFDPDTGSSVITLDENSITLSVGDTSLTISESGINITGNLSVTRPDGTSGTVTINGDAVTSGGSVVSPS